MTTHTVWNPTATVRLQHDLANNPLLVAGEEAKWFVRAALTPGLTTAGLAAMVQHLTVGGYRGRIETEYATAETRATIAAAAIRGFVSREDVAAEPSVWHRWVGGVGIEVSAA